jgi:hypothetical protein
MSGCYLSASVSKWVCWLNDNKKKIIQKYPTIILSQNIMTTTPLSYDFFWIPIHSFLFATAQTCHGGMHL